MDGTGVAEGAGIGVLVPARPAVGVDVPAGPAVGVDVPAGEQAETRKMTRTRIDPIFLDT